MQGLCQLELLCLHKIESDHANMKNSSAISLARTLSQPTLNATMSRLFEFFFAPPDAFFLDHRVLLLR